MKAKHVTEKRDDVTFTVRVDRKLLQRANDMRLVSWRTEIEALLETMSKRRRATPWKKHSS